MNKKEISIVLITSGQPSLNPRLVKEADSLANAGYKVSVIYQYWNDWGTVLDEELFPYKKWKAICVGGNPTTDNFNFLKNKVVHHIAKKIIELFGIKNGIAEMALGRSTNQLIKKAKSIPASLYIAHNLGALPAAVKAAKKYHAKCGFDAEDFHRQETSDNPKSVTFRLAKFIEDKYLLKLDYFTASSQLIAKRYKEIYTALKPEVIYNVFPKNLIQNISSKNDSLQLFWFSQTIGKGRGIEDAIKAIGVLQKKHICLQLLGKIDDSHQHYFLNLALNAGLEKHQITFISPVSSERIFEIAHTCDIGLALEQNLPHNRDICLTNKIFSYLTAGIAIIASETTSQRKFILDHPTIGKSFPIGDVDRLSKIINEYDVDRALLYSTKESARTLAIEKYNWEKEQEKFIQIIEKNLLN